ncbi:MAG: cadmium-containing carbonic anhydrase, partial [Flaviflexus sp.]|nr:cadmium-containing carbonic anhydrase [Flaviflexus sp.]
MKLAPATALVPATGPLPERCVDGRGPVIGSLGASPCLPGAFLAPTLALADGEAAKDTETLVGTTRRSGEADMRGAATRLVEIMRADGFQPRVHTGPTPGGGCGAVDALPDILALTHEPGIFPAAGALGLPEPTPVTHTGAATFLYELVEEQALAGRHAESFIVINRAPGMTVDRTALPCAVFWVDAWALDTTADY